MRLRSVQGAEELAEIRALKERDPAAIARIYRLHHGVVRAFAQRMLSDNAAAEDVVHDVFVELPAAIARFRGDSKLETFLISIAVNLCRHRIRSAQRGRKAVRNLQERAIPTGVETPESETRRRHLAAALNRGLRTLPPEQREAFVLCAVEERTSFEVAEILDVPDTTVRTRLRQARKKLRVFLEEAGIR